MAVGDPTTLAPKNFNDFNPFLRYFFIDGTHLNQAFFNQTSDVLAKEEASTITDNHSEKSDEQENPILEAVDSPLLVDNTEKERLEADNKKKQAAEKLYQLLEMLQALFEKDKKIFSAYAMINWMEIHLAAINDEDLVVQEKLRDAAQALFQGTKRMNKRAANWDWRMMMTYSLVAAIGFSLTLIAIPAVASQTAGVASVLTEEGLLSSDSVSDILLNSVDGIANLSSAYRQWQLGETKMACVNLFGGLQTIVGTSTGVGLCIDTVIRHGLQSPHTQTVFAMAGSLLGVSCALGMFCSATVENMEYQQCEKRKDKLIDELESLFKDRNKSYSPETIAALKKIADPVELLKQTRQLVEKSREQKPALSSEESLSPETDPIFDNKVETLVRGIAIAKAQSNNHLNNRNMFLLCGGAMTLLAACTFSSVIVAAATPFVVQGAALLSAIVTKYVSSAYDNIKKVEAVLGEKTSQDIQAKQDKIKEAYDRSYTGYTANILGSPIHYIRKQLFQNSASTQKEADKQKRIASVESDRDASEKSNTSLLGGTEPS